MLKWISDKLRCNFRQGVKMKNIYVEPFFFPRFLYIWIANKNWNNTAKKNGIRPEDLYRRL